MYVCICRAISDRAVRREVEAGACSVRDLRQRLGLGSVCGRCVPEARRLIVEQLAQQNPALAASDGIETVAGVSRASSAADQEARCG